MYAPDDELPLDDLFGTAGPDAIGLSILRVAMFPGGELNGRLVMEAKQKGARVIGTTWSAPGTWKSNGSSENGGVLLPQNYDAWAARIAAFVDEFDLDAMSLGNAPDFATCSGGGFCSDPYDSMLFTAKQMVEWVKTAAPVIKAASPNTKIIAPEPYQWNHLWSNLSATGPLDENYPHSTDPLSCGCFANTLTTEAEAECAEACEDGDGYDYGHWLAEDPDAWAAVDILGVQQYASQRAYPWPADVTGGVREKEIWMTEMGGVQYWPEGEPTIDIENGVAVAGWIHSALTIGEASAWLYWWYDAYFRDSNEGLALIQGEETIAKRYYALGNYSKFVRPGFVAVTVTGNDDEDVLLSAYIGGSGEVVVVAVNRAQSDVTVPISLSGGTAPSAFTPYRTTEEENLEEQAEVPVTDDTFMATLPGLSVTTFVGD